MLNYVVYQTVIWLLPCDASISFASSTIDSFLLYRILWKTVLRHNYLREQGVIISIH
uniref:Uncharacterized protein n=1 Tax=Anguilla anguilla TaxID=7936 RepID=A0A0E9RMG1_ANGAN